MKDISKARRRDVGIQVPCSRSYFSRTSSNPSNHRVATNRPDLSHITPLRSHT